ncbi:MAG TPA: LanC-like protein [Gaiellaceae bacterium]|nr:LanC-like protein [Gaiellaceae bacterium]
MLYEPEAFEPLVDDPWDAARVRDAIARVVADTDAAFDADALWPANEWDAWASTPPLKSLYSGAAGVVWALDELRRKGLAETSVDLTAALVQARELWREAPDLAGVESLPVPPEPSLLCGEGGILLTAWRVSPSTEVADALLARVRENLANEAEELMWGAPGTLLAATSMHRWTGEKRWLDAARESADAVRSRRDEDGLWTQRLYGGAPTRLLGPVHGLVGIVHALLAAQGEEALRRETAALLGREAILEDGVATWPAVAGGPLAPASGIRLQWCHGAPGMVATAREYLDEELLLGGAELTWRAGAHREEKGAGLCHGTSGNGFALLAAFARRGDETWLERARRFAVHALAQADRLAAASGGRRHSLFTGDLGVALFAAACLDGDPAFPVLDAD